MLSTLMALKLQYHGHIKVNYPIISVRNKHLHTSCYQDEPKLVSDSLFFKSADYLVDDQ